MKLRKGEGRPSSVWAILCLGIVKSTEKESLGEVDFSSML